MAQVDSRLRTKFSDFGPVKVRNRLLDQRPFDEQRMQRFQFRPLDMRYACIVGQQPLGL
jgi:hypothetical protein